ncbi:MULTISPECIES: hypothetical protein [unclassified Acidovorax]|uniref:hypothetical protein n=1 Tax=unclassified Acidovorax TaxID=2684926 RepID=UPI000B3FDEFF|nr:MULTISPECIES: hypothetical protein [unclassified Acidovorax]
MTPSDLKNIVKTYRYTDALYVVVDSLPQPYQDGFANFLVGSTCPIADGRNRYAYVADFDRWIASLSQGEESTSGPG